MSEILRELQEDLQNERLQKLWHSFGKLIIGLSIAIVIGTATIVIWGNVQRSKAMELTSQLIRGADRTKVEDYQGAIAAFDAVPPGAKVYTFIAALRKAQAQTALGNKEEAARTYAQAAHGNINAFSDLAGLLAAADGQNAPPFSVNSPFHYSHAEQNAWRLLKEGEKEEAIQHFLSLRDDKEVPGSLRQRAAIIVDYLAPTGGRAQAAGHEG